MGGLGPQTRFLEKGQNDDLKGQIGLQFRTPKMSGSSSFHMSVPIFHWYARKWQKKGKYVNISGG